MFHPDDQILKLEAEEETLITWKKEMDNFWTKAIKLLNAAS